MSLSTLGTVAILILFLLTVATACLAGLGAYRRSERLIEGSVSGMHAIFGMAGFASALLVYGFLSGDYSIQYIQENGHPAMPIFYKVTAFWGSLDGSLLFWVLLLSLFASMAIRANAKRHRALIPHAVLVLAIILGFFTALLLFHKNPFNPFLLDYERPPTGKGMNPLLQNPYMIFHPPSLYLGMVSIAVPYAFAMAAMITGQVDSAWQRSVRRWVLFSWMFLGVGLVLGGLWAYEELGWGGYWAWDPVENAGLFPWLTCTAFLHSVMVQERRGMLKVWNLLLVCLTFLLTIFGTFLTRSGVVESVHAFGEDPKLAWAFGIFMIVIFLVSLALILWRLPLLRSRNELESVLSREFAFLVNNWLFLAAALFVVGATTYPSIRQGVGNLMEAYPWFADFMSVFGVHERPDRITIGPTFFNHYMTPVGLALLLLTGVGPLVAWRKTSKKSLKEQFLWPLVFGAVAVVAAGFAVPMIELSELNLVLPPESWKVWEAKLEGIRSGWGLLCFGLCAFTAATVFQEYYRGVKVRRKNSGEGVIDALVSLIVKARRRYGGYIVHLGVVLVFFGFAGNSYKLERKLGMYPGDTVELGDYTVRHDGIRASEDWQKDMVTVELSVLRDGEVVDQLTPAKWWYYQSPQEPTTEHSRYMTAAGDVYASIDDADFTTGWTRFNLYYNPLVNWVWLGFVTMLFGGVICIGTRRSDKDG